MNYAEVEVRNTAADEAQVAADAARSAYNLADIVAYLTRNAADAAGTALNARDAKAAADAAYDVYIVCRAANVAARAKARTASAAAYAARAIALSLPRTAG